MKNVANCDSWCELQNPVNHGVFERKLRPKPLGRGHVCLGVTHCVAPTHLTPRPERGRGPRRGWGGSWLPVQCVHGQPETRFPRRGGRDKWWSSRLCASCRQAASRRALLDPVRDESFGERGDSRGLRPQVRRGYPLSLSISISGGKETNEDSPSNGERTGNSPSLESGGSAVRIVAWRSVLSGGPSTSPLEWGTGEGDSPVVLGPCRTTRRCRRVGLFGNAALIGR